MSGGSVTRRNGALAVSGELTFYTAGSLFTAGTALLGSADAVDSVDLQDVTRADSAGLALLLEWLGYARASGRALRFVNVPGQVERMLQANGLAEALAAGPGG